MTLDQLKIEANSKWQEFYRAATASGVWFLCFAASLALAKLLEGGALVITMLTISFPFCVMTLVHTMGAAREAQAASRKCKAESKCQATMNARV